MALAPLTPAALRAAADDTARLAPGDLALVARVVGEVLLAQAEARAPAPSTALVDARLEALGATAHTGALGALRPLDVLRTGPRDERERAVLSALLARHLGAVLEGDDGEARLRALVASLDWLEFTGPYAPYTAARAALALAPLERFERLVRAAPVHASSAGAAAAVRALRAVDAPAPSSPAGTDDAGPTLREPPRFESPGPRAGSSPPPGAPEPRANTAPLTVAGELAGLSRGWLARALALFTLWSALRGAALTILRVVFTLRRPATLTLDGGALRLLGHTELLGRTLRTFDVRLPVEALAEVRREVRYPLLPAALALCALLAGALLGARAVVEGAGVGYFPLIALGLGGLLLGVVFELLARALFPGLRGRARLYVRGRDAAALELTDLPADELDRLLEGLVAQQRQRPASARPSARASERPPARA